MAEIQEIYDLRLMIEPYLLREAIARMTPEQLTSLKTIIHNSRQAEDTTVWAGLNVDFHRSLYAMAERPLAMQLLENLLVRADRYLKMQQFLSADTQAESDAQHQRILDLVAARDVEGAMQALRDHILWNAGDVRNTLVGLAGSE
jgi:DNA-binding GntR family transcriptional regulator